MELQKGKLEELAWHADEPNLSAVRPSDPVFSTSSVRVLALFSEVLEHIGDEASGVRVAAAQGAVDLSRGSVLALEELADLTF